MTLLFAEEGESWAEIERELSSLKAADFSWKTGRVPVYVYQHSDELARISQQAFLEYFTESALGPRAFPSVKTLESGVLEMALDLLGAGPKGGGTFTSGGTESIFLAIKAARDWARAERAIDRPKIVMATSGHATANKAADYLGVEVVRAPLRADRRADVAALEAAIDDRTILLYGSAPSYPHGVFDPIEEMAQLARKHGIWFHVDACVGGLLGTFARELGHPIPRFDLSVDGVTTLSVDLHKHGYAAKGASLVLFADRECQKYERFEFDWKSKGIYATETFQGTRPAGPIASSWAVMKALGRSGYREAARTIMAAKKRLTTGIDQIEGLKVGTPHDLSIFFYESSDPDLDIFAVADVMVERGWFVGRLVEPKAIQMALNPLVVPAIDDYLADLKESVVTARNERKVGEVDLRTY